METNPSRRMPYRVGGRPRLGGSTDSASRGDCDRATEFEPFAREAAICHVVRTACPVLLLTLLALGDLLGCRTVDSGATGALQGQEKCIPWRLAASFHCKFGTLCRLSQDKPCCLTYLGSLGTIAQGGIQPPFERSHNLWRVSCFIDTATGHFVAAPVDDPEFLLKQRSGDIEARELFHLRIGRFERGPNVIPVQMGQYKFDILIDPWPRRDIDKPLPELGRSIRSFVTLIEKPTPWDESCGIRDRMVLPPEYSGGGPSPTDEHCGLQDHPVETRGAVRTTPIRRRQ